MDDAEDLISHLSGSLAPADRAAFRRAAENALATSPQSGGKAQFIEPSLQSFNLANYFRPPREDRGTAWASGKKKLSKLVSEPPRKDRRVSRRSHSMK
jgi:hypothetical protein